MGLALESKAQAEKLTMTLLADNKPNETNIDRMYKLQSALTTLKNSLPEALETHLSNASKLQTPHKHTQSKSPFRFFTMKKIRKPKQTPYQKFLSKHPNLEISPTYSTIAGSSLCTLATLENYCHKVIKALWELYYDFSTTNQSLEYSSKLSKTAFVSLKMEGLKNFQNEGEIVATTSTASTCQTTSQSTSTSSST